MLHEAIRPPGLVAFFMRWIPAKKYYFRPTK